MNKKYYMEALSDETLAKMIDKTLKYEKASKNRNIRVSLLKIIPVAAAVVLVIGGINILPSFIKNTGGPAGNGGDDVNSAASMPSDTSDYINIITYTNETTLENVENDDTVTTQIGNLYITTPKGQEPIQNEDGTITLPGGGTYAFKGKVRITMPSGSSYDFTDGNYTIVNGIVVNSDGNINMSLPANIGKEITYESDLNGEQFTVVFEKNGDVIWNGKNINDVYKEVQDKFR
ncbi:MAG: hypothetical protein FWD71_17135 [Oscillospiraceae bacterium]|nr:hypothetical protein [Oscillospiraceae bacterium]